MFIFSTVWQEDCSQQEAAPDEVAQRSADLDDLDDLDNELNDLVAEGTLDDLTPAPPYLSRSLSRISRMEPQRVNIPVSVDVMAHLCFYAHFFCLLVPTLHLIYSFCDKRWS